jgi:hypothetical protein
MTSVRRVVGSLFVVGAAMAAMVPPAAADEGGASFWIPGQYGSFIAVPDEPGWTLPIVFYANKGNAGVEKRFTRGGVITTGLDGSGTLTLISPTYTFRGTPLGGRASLGLGWGFGKMDVTSDATLTGPTGGVLERNVSDTYSGMSDLYPEGALRWNDGTSNYMLYVMGGVPIGAYSADRLASVGLGHGAIDGGGAFTYYDQPNGREVSRTRTRTTRTGWTRISTGRCRTSSTRTRTPAWSATSTISCRATTATARCWGTSRPRRPPSVVSWGTSSTRVRASGTAR